MHGHLRLGLMPEEGIVQLLVVDLNFAHLWSDFFSHLRLERLGVFLLGHSLSHLHNASSFDEFWQVERRLLETSFAL